MAGKHRPAPRGSGDRVSRSPLKRLRRWLAVRAALRDRIDVRRGDPPYESVVWDGRLPAPAMETVGGALAPETLTTAKEPL